jgi:hypothetical protein
VSTAFRLTLAAVLGAVGLLAVLSALATPRRPLALMPEYLARPARVSEQRRRLAAERLVEPFERAGFRADVLADLRLVGRPPAVHAALLAAAAFGGLVLPALAVAMAQIVGVVDLTVTVALLVCLASAVVAPLVVHTSMRGRAATIRADLRHQLSAYLDVVTMLLAANVGNEGALRQAAMVGDGRFFVELRRRMLSAETSNRSMVSALAQLGDDLELAELQQVAASAALGASSGAPVARTLAAKCSSLRQTLAAEQETEARVRAGKITIPLVGMSLLIMTAVIYPALQFSS